MDMYCEFKDTGMIYNKRKVYECEICHMQLAMDDPKKSRVMCFKKQQQFYSLVSGEDIEQNNILPENLEKESIRRVLEKNSKNTENNEELCSQEEINSRLEICKRCSYYQNDTCLMCGCTVIREANYRNKLAKKNQSCPINKWGPTK